MRDEGRTGLVGLTPQVGHCGICLEARVCRMADEELGRPVCPDCVEAVVAADRVLWVAAWKGYGICRPGPARGGRF